jgi:hypothetical protein
MWLKNLFVPESTVDALPFRRLTPEAQFIVPVWGNNVYYGIGLSYRPDRLHMLAGRTTTLCHSRLCPPSKGLRIWLLCIGPIVGSGPSHMNIRKFFRE